MAQKKVLFIIAQNGFRDEEFFIPAEVLENNGIHVTVASIESGMCHGSLSGKVEAEISVSEARIKDYDCLAIAGGPGAKALKDFPEVISIIRDAEKNKKLIAAICIAPTILAEAGILKGKRATVWNTDKQQGKFIESKGAKYTGKEVEVDGDIITADGPMAAGPFGNAIVESLNRK
jgi:protease I